MIYADANGSLPPLPEVRAHVKKRLDSALWANPTAIHSLGGKLKAGLERCRAMVADTLGADPAHVVWNSGSSEGLSTVIRSVLLPAGKRRVLYRAGIEHAVVAAAFAELVRVWNYEERLIPVDADGLADVAWLERELRALGGDAAMVALMAANNETGVIQPWQRTSELCRASGVPFLCDTTAWIGRLPFHFLNSGLDWAFVPGHKLGALPGSGCLLARSPGDLRPLVWGGGQEEGVRGGTGNYLGAESLAIAVQALPAKLAHAEAHVRWRAELEAALPAGCVVIGQRHPRAPGTTLIGYPGLHGQAVQIELEALDIFVTTSAACSDNEPATSKVLRAMGVHDDLGRSVVRISLPLTATQADYRAIAMALPAVYERLCRIGHC
jgi:cysteine desulfurase